MKKSIYDKAQDKLNKRIGSAMEVLKQNFSNTLKFRQPNVTPREKFYQYVQNWTPELEGRMRQEEGDLATDAFKNDMEKLGEEFNGRT